MTDQDREDEARRELERLDKKIKQAEGMLAEEYERMAHDYSRRAQAARNGLTRRFFSYLARRNNARARKLMEGA